LSVDKDNSNALRYGATESTGGFQLVINGNVVVWGVKFQVGVGGAVNVNLTVGGSTTTREVQHYINCGLYLQTTSASPSIIVGGLNNTNQLTLFVFDNCVFGFSATGQTIQTRGNLQFIGCSLDTGKSSPTVLIKPSTTYNIGVLKATSCDFAFASALWLVSAAKQYAARFSNCKAPSTLFSGTHSGLGGSEIEMMACGTATDDHIYQYSYIDGSGQITQNTGVYLTTGAATVKDQDGTATPLSLSLVSSSSASIWFPLKSPWFNVEITSTGSKTLSVKCANTTAALKDNESWIEVEYMGSTAHPGTTNDVDAPVVSGTTSLNILSAGSTRTDTAEAWTGITGEITHTLSKTVTVNQQGWARARVCLAKASSTVYVDPQVTVA
jgi:hypothetical protein